MAQVADYGLAGTREVMLGAHDRAQSGGSSSGSSKRRSRPAFRAGTLRWMAPELLRASTDGADAFTEASDVYRYERLQLLLAGCFVWWCFVVTSSGRLDVCAAEVVIFARGWRFCGVESVCTRKSAIRCMYRMLSSRLLPILPDCIHLVFFCLFFASMIRDQAGVFVCKGLFFLDSG